MTKLEIIARAYDGPAAWWWQDVWDQTPLAQALRRKSLRSTMEALQALKLGDCSRLEDEALALLGDDLTCLPDITAAETFDAMIDAVLLGAKAEFEQS